MLSGLNKRDRNIIGISFLAILFTVFLCFVINYGKPDMPATSAKNRVEVVSVKNHLGLMEVWKKNFVCQNSNGIYLSEGHGIYEYTESGNRLVKDLGEYQARIMVCTNDYLIYDAGASGTFRLNLKTGDSVLLFESGSSVSYIVANEQDYFITLSTPQDETGKFIKTYLFRGSSLAGVELTQYLEPVEGEDFYYGTYGGYELYGHYDAEGSRPAKYISLIKKEGWQGCNIEGASCCVNDSYLFFRHTDNMYWCFYDNRKREIQTLRELAETSRDECGLYAGLSAVYDNRLYCLVQYSRGRYAGYPNPSGPTSEAVIRISPLDRGEGVIYQTMDKYERIVGFDIEAEVVYIYNDEYAEVREVNYKTGGYEVIKDNLPDNTTLLFEWCGDKLFIMDESRNQFIDAVN